jgi:formylglycine-generating enzyme required for sulfatase activity
MKYLRFLLFSMLCILCVQTVSAQGVVRRNKPKQEQQKQKPKQNSGGQRRQTHTNRSNSSDNNNAHVQSRQQQTQQTQQTQQVQPVQTTGTTSTRDPILAQIDRGMVYVEGGTFVMGGTSEQGGDAESDEKPTHSVTLSSYYISDHEVTQAEWEAMMGSNPSYFKGGNLPVENVSWDDCQEFIRKLNSLTGLRFRLPTEAEWEYAARGGSRSRGYKYSGSNTLGDVAWYTDNSGSKTHPVKQKQSNELGLYDMSGNVWEWCQDWYSSYSSSSQSNPQGHANGSYRVDRGGGWDSNAGSCRVSIRGSYAPSGRDSGLGFRLAR